MGRALSEQFYSGKSCRILALWNINSSARTAEKRSPWSSTRPFAANPTSRIAKSAAGLSRSAIPSKTASSSALTRNRSNKPDSTKSSRRAKIRAANRSVLSTKRTRASVFFTKSDRYGHTFAFFLIRAGRGLLTFKDLRSRDGRKLWQINCPQLSEEPHVENSHPPLRRAGFRITIGSNTSALVSDDGRAAALLALAGKRHQFPATAHPRPLGGEIIATDDWLDVAGAVTDEATENGNGSLAAPVALLCIHPAELSELPVQAPQQRCY